MKQSSIEWLFEQYKLVGMLTTAQVQKAKAMHRDEIENAHIEGQRVFDDHPHTQWTTDQAELYYEKTFKSTKEK